MESAVDQLKLPSTETGSPPDQRQSQPETPIKPEQLTPPLFQSNMMSKCSAPTHPIGAPDDQPQGRGDIQTPNQLTSGPDEDYEGEYVQQNIQIDGQLPGERDIQTPNQLTPGPNEVYEGEFVKQNIKTG